MDHREKLFKRLDGLLQILSYCCDDRECMWPSGSLLCGIDNCVMSLIQLERKKPPWPAWKTFKTLDRRRRSLRLVPRINSLVKRAIARRKERCAESVLEKAVRRPDSLETEILLRDFVQEKGKFVDLLNDNNVRLMEREASWPLLHWLCGMDHPDAQNLILHDVEPARLAGALLRDAFSQSRRLVNRLKNRERQKRHRQRKKSLPEKRY